MSLPPCERAKSDFLKLSHIVFFPKNNVFLMHKNVGFSAINIYKEILVTKKKTDILTVTKRKYG